MSVDLSFEEKSAWGSLLAIGVASWLFFPVAIVHIAAGGNPAELAGRAIFVVAVIVIIEVIYHSVTALSSRDHSSDERDKHIGLKADSKSGYILAVAICYIVGHIVLRSVVPGASPAPSGLLIAVYLLMALTATEAFKLLWKIWYYRAGI